jgi:transposase
MGWVSGQSYSDDLQARVLAAVDRGGRVHEIAPLFQVSVSYIDTALARHRATGVVTALPKFGRPVRKLESHVEALSARIAAHPDATLDELDAWSRQERGMTVCVATMWATVDALGLTLKKSHSTRRNRNEKASLPDVPRGAPAKAA